MDTDMELIKKTTILFPPDLYEKLALVAKQQKSSVGELVRDACRKQYFLTNTEDRLAAVQEMAELDLPVGSPEEMERESMPRVEPLP